VPAKAILVLVALATLVVGACGAAEGSDVPAQGVTPSATSGDAVTIDTFQFTPAALDVVTGATVVSTPSTTP
jgi:hypothetical protein